MVEWFDRELHKEKTWQGQRHGRQERGERLESEKEREREIEIDIEREAQAIRDRAISGLAGSSQGVLG